MRISDWSSDVCSSDLYSDRVLRHCSPEFRAAVETFAAGYRDGIGQPGFSDLQVRDALIAIEVGNVIDGLSRTFAMPGVRALRAPAILALVLPVLGDAEARAYAEAAQSASTKQQDVGAALPSRYQQRRVGNRGGRS